MSKSGPLDKYLPFILAFLQFGLIILAVFNSNGLTVWWQWVLFVLGSALGIWAIVTMRWRVSVLPTVRNNQQLQTGGPYRFIRHPMYSAVLLVCASLLFRNMDLLDVAIWLSLVFVLTTKMTYEEKDLLKAFKEYKHYTQHTKRLLPFIL